jgi:hypothetical protein
MPLKPTAQPELPHRLVRQEGPMVRWRIRVAVAEGQQFIDLSKPFARLGAEKRCELWLPALGAPVAVFMLATNEGVFVYDFSCPGVFARHAAGIWKAGQEIVVGPYRLTLLEYRYLGLAQTSQSPMHELDIETKKPGRNVFRPMHSVAFLGQSVRCDLRLRHRSIAELHCAFMEFPEGLMVADLFSPSKVWIHQAEVDYSLLRDGESVRCGEVDLVAKKMTEGVSGGGGEAGMDRSPFEVETGQWVKHEPSLRPAQLAAQWANAPTSSQVLPAENVASIADRTTRVQSPSGAAGHVAPLASADAAPDPHGAEAVLQPTHGLTQIGSGTGNSLSSASPGPSAVRPWRSLRGDGQTAQESSSAGGNLEPPRSGPTSAMAKPSVASAPGLPPYNGVSRGAARIQRGPTVIVAEQPRQEMSVMERLVESRKQDADRAFRWKMARILSMFLIAVSLGWVVWSRIPPGWRSLILNLGQQSAPSPSAPNGIEVRGAKSGLR